MRVLNNLVTPCPLPGAASGGAVAIAGVNCLGSLQTKDENLAEILDGAGQELPGNRRCRPEIVGLHNILELERSEIVMIAAMEEGYAPR